MTDTEKRTIADALERFSLVTGSAGDGKTTACASTLLAWVNGDEWGTTITCAHPTLNALIVPANDGTDADQEADRRRIVEAGEHGILDTWWVPGIVVAWAISKAPRGVSGVVRLVAIADAVAAWKLGDHARPTLDAGANLTGAYLAGANLTGANLAGANLAGAYLAGANLTGANLTGAYLADANLTDANLTGANLAGANLAGANLTGANLTGANLADANLADAYLADAYLTGARGNELTKLPAGWKVAESGLIVADDAAGT